ncbi:MAG: hypothetical protein ACLKAK_07280 [Alkaliphilus sp.]
MLIPTPELRNKLRQFLDEKISITDVAADTRFSDAEIDALLTEASHINNAAAAGWTLKATWVMSERGGLEKSQAGDEKHEFIKLTEYRDHCLAMAKLYAHMTPKTGSKLLGYDLPDVGGITQ